MNVISTSFKMRTCNFRLIISIMIHLLIFLVTSVMVVTITSTPCLLALHFYKLYYTMMSWSSVIHWDHVEGSTKLVGGNKEFYYLCDFNFILFIRSILLRTWQLKPTIQVKSK